MKRRYVVSVLLVFVMILVAELLGEKEMIFPLAAALPMFPVYVAVGVLLFIPLGLCVNYLRKAVLKF
jgi:glycopeptide antibiotics resistance protein